ncbi:MAG: helix-hairpin-helix domain-containing protein [candidate division Zixibacteria bacterium]|nr:helix-hairpin-helix domain-containing protein [candidate division Zixibacteria bacterium]
MNRFFDFTSRQLKFLALLSATAVLMGIYLLAQSYATPAEEPLSLEIHLGEVSNELTGIFQLDPNTAPVDSLELLPGIGKALADRIVEYRRHQPFETEIDITEVNGIGPRTYERLKPYLRIRKY